VPVADITHADPQRLFHDWNDLLAAIRQTGFGTGQAHLGPEQELLLMTRLGRTEWQPFKTRLQD
jgi:hypothetical protein